MTGNFTSGCSRLALVWLLLLGAFSALAQVPPGNALDFLQNSTVMTGTELPDYNNNFTVEAWVRTGSAPRYITTFVSTGDNFYLGIYGYNDPTWGGKAVFHVHSTFIFSTTSINDGKWHHLAGVNNNGAAAIYVDGVLENTGSGGGLNYSGDPSLQLRLGNFDTVPYEYGVDEVRIWSTARSAAQVKASFNNVITPLPQAGLAVYYNFDRGTAGGSNAGVNTLPNLGSLPGYTGTLSNFALSGATANWIESYALVQPTNLAATSAASGTSITATWTAPPVGTISNYVLDCATTADFSAGVTTVLPAGNATSATVTGRAVNTRYYLRLRADKTSVTGQGAYSRGGFGLRTASGLTAPGNALAFDGADDFVAGTNGGLPQGNAPRTLEAWVLPTATGTSQVIFNYGTATANQRSGLLVINNHLYYVGENNDLEGSRTLTDGHWHHVAATYDGTTLKLFVDGVLDVSGTPSAFGTTGTTWRIGSRILTSTNLGEQFSGRIDEVRAYNTALTPAQLQADMTSPSAAVPASLVTYYDFDQGTAGGANSAQTMLVDRSLNYQDGTLTNFALSSGSTTSNLVESYALVLPTLAASSGISTTGFTANWTAPAVGTANGYVLDYSLSPTFATGVTSLAQTTATSQAVSGLLPNRNYYYRVRADKTSLTGQGGYAVGSARTASGLTPPGNALAFDGADDYVAIAARPALDNLATGSFTMEAWVYSTNVAAVNSIIRKGGDYNLVLLPGGLLYAEAWPAGMGMPTRSYAQATVAIPQNRWVHVASTYSGGTFRLYVDGVDAQATQGSSPITTAEALQLGRSVVYDQPFNGRLDEVRVYNAALTPAQVQADMKSTSAALPASLVAYFNFDQGTAGGSNGTATTLTDQSSSLADGTLTNFDLSSGNLTSNWVESYALVVPTLTAATGSTTTGFTANWTAPAVGTVDGYRLEVATANTFAGAALVAGSPFSAAGTSLAVTGLDPAQTYYYRVRAEKASVTGQGAFSALGIRRPATPLPPPGNALAFDGVNDEVRTAAAPIFGTGSFTLEAWVRTSTASTVPFVAMGSVGGDDYWLGINNQRATISISGAACTGTSLINDGHWHHLAGVRNGTELTMYVDGVAQNTLTNTNSASPAAPLGIGSFGNGSYFWPGRLDEVRVYNTALTPAQVQADMTSTGAAVPASLVAYYNFDQGTAGGANQGYTTLTDQTANGAAGTLVNFDLSSGNLTSNWVESYALLVPTGLAVSARTSTGFTASWAAPTINGTAPVAGIVEGYVLDVSTSATFTVGVTSFPVTGYATTSLAVTGLTNGTDYYLRVRAEKATVTGQGLYTPTISTHTVGTDAKLTNLTASAGQLTPAFATATLTYTLYLPAGTSTYTLTPTASNGYTGITINGAAVASGAVSAALSVGSTATVVVTSEDANTTTTYTVQATVAPGYFRSVATGSWGSPATWESSADNASWAAAPVAPLYQFLPVVTVRNGHTVTVATAESLRTVTIESGGVLTTVAGQTLSIPGGAAVTVAAGGVLSIGQLSGVTSGNSSSYGTLSLAGTLTVSGTVVLNTNSAPATGMGFTASTAVFGAGSRLVLFATTTTPVIPVATWNAAATLELAGAVASTTVAGSLNGKTLGSLEVNLAGSGTHSLLTGTNTATLAGNLTVTSTGTGTLRLLTQATSSGGALTINGGYVQNGGTVTGCAAAAAFLIGNTNLAVNVAGSFTVAGGSFTANQGYNTTSTTIRPNPLTIGGTLTVRAGATFSLVSAVGTLSGTTNVANTAYATSRVSLLGNLINEGTLTTGSSYTTTNGQQLYFAKAGVQTFANTGTIGSATNPLNATVNSGSTLDMGTSRFTGIGSFTAGAGATLRFGDPDGITAAGNAVGNLQNTSTTGTTGTRTLTGATLVFAGTMAQTLNATFPFAALNNASARLVFDNPAGVTLAAPVSTNAGTLQLRQGVVTSTATNLLTLGTGPGVPGTLDATATNTGFVAGPFKRWITGTTGPRTFPVGTPTQLRPATIDFTTAPTTAGSLTAEFIVLPSGNQGLPLTENGITISKASGSGYWRVAAADGLAGGTYTPTFTFTGALGILDYTQLVLLKRADPSADWALVGTHVPTTGSNAAPVLSRTGMSGFSDFTAGGDLNVNPLPVELVAFTARAQGDAVALDWRTASEKNSRAFDVERSLDGRAFGRIGTVAAAGSSSAPRSYSFVDGKLPAGVALLYYRLKQVDQNGTFAYSPVRAVLLTAKAEAGLALYPNPASAQATLTGALPGAVVTVYDALGRQVLAAPADAAGTAALVLPAGLPAGVYLVRSGSHALRLVVQ